MSGVPALPSAPGVRLALPPWPGGDGRQGSPGRAALGLALLVCAAGGVLAVLVATGRIDLPGAGSATAVPARQASPRPSANLAPAQRHPSRAAEAGPASDRVVAPTHATALFARHSWYMAPPPAPPTAPPPPPEPTAPPLPYTFLGSFAPGGEVPVYFLAHHDRVIDAHVGDRLDGVYQFESVAGGQLVFVYLPLNLRQSLAARVSP